MFEFIGKYFFLLCIGTTALNVYVAGPKREGSGLNGTVSAAEIQTVRHRIFAAKVFPWVVMGFAQTVGGVPDLWSFFRPRDLNPFVWSWYASIFLLSCAFAYWVLIRGGAKYVITMNLVRVYGLRGPVAVSERWVKVFAALGPIFTVAWVRLVWMMEFPAIPGAR